MLHPSKVKARHRAKWVSHRTQHARLTRGQNRESCLYLDTLPEWVDDCYYSPTPTPPQCKSSISSLDDEQYEIVTFETDRRDLAPSWIDISDAPDFQAHLRRPGMPIDVDFVIDTTPNLRTNIVGTSSREERVQFTIESYDSASDVMVVVSECGNVRFRQRRLIFDDDGDDQHQSEKWETAEVAVDIKFSGILNYFTTSSTTQEWVPFHVRGGGGTTVNETVETNGLFTERYYSEHGYIVGTGLYSSQPRLFSEDCDLADAFFRRNVAVGDELVMLNRGDRNDENYGGGWPLISGTVLEVKRERRIGNNYIFVTVKLSSGCTYHHYTDDNCVDMAEFFRFKQQQQLLPTS